MVVGGTPTVTGLGERDIGSERRDVQNPVLGVE